MQEALSKQDSASEADVLAARQALDAHVQDIVQWHFNPKSGCSFWLDFAKKAGWDPRKEIKSFGDLQKFDEFY